MTTRFQLGEIVQYSSILNREETGVITCVHTIGDPEKDQWYDIVRVGGEIVNGVPETDIYYGIQNVNKTLDDLERE